MSLLSKLLHFIAYNGFPVLFMFVLIIPVVLLLFVRNKVWRYKKKLPIILVLVLLAAGTLLLKVKHYNSFVARYGMTGEATIIQKEKVSGPKTGNTMEKYTLSLKMPDGGIRTIYFTSMQPILQPPPKGWTPFGELPFKEGGHLVVKYIPGDEDNFIVLHENTIDTVVP